MFIRQQLADFVLKKISARASNTIIGISEMAEKSCIKRLQKEYRALCKVCLPLLILKFLCNFRYIYIYVIIILIVL